jgi:hypothetical protein
VIIFVLWCLQAAQALPPSLNLAETIKENYLGVFIYPAGVFWVRYLGDLLLFACDCQAYQ